MSFLCKEYNGIQQHARIYRGCSAAQLQEKGLPTQDLSDGSTRLPRILLALGGRGSDNSISPATCTRGVPARCLSPRCCRLFRDNDRSKYKTSKHHRCRCLCLVLPSERSLGYLATLLVKIHGWWQDVDYRRGNVFTLVSESVATRRCGKQKWKFLAVSSGLLENISATNETSDGRISLTTSLPERNVYCCPDVGKK
ncbi:hypothetical protein J6590_054398 [Homalodisca vitripennis]|nr:hypothetical protein J6590_054398 [Homalodisca vitripennis]